MVRQPHDGRMCCFVFRVLDAQMSIPASPPAQGLVPACVWQLPLACMVCTLIHAVIQVQAHLLVACGALPELHGS